MAMTGASLLTQIDLLFCENSSLKMKFNFKTKVNAHDLTFTYASKDTVLKSIIFNPDEIEN